MTPTTGSVTRGFISYHRPDNVSFDEVVDKLKAEIEEKYEATTGNHIDLFLDRDDIGWGANWRQAIRQSLEEATVFIPIITMRYFNSEPCREELLTFYHSAKELGITQLLLPLVLAGSDRIRADDPREEVRIVEELNYRNINPAYIAGYGSPDWRETIGGLITDLSSAIERAESEIANREAEALSDTTEQPAPSPGADDEGVPPLDQPSSASTGVVADFSELMERTLALAPQVEKANEAMQRLSEVPGELGSLEGKSPSQQKAALIRVASRIGPVAAEFLDDTSKLLTTVYEVDAQLRAYIAEMAGIDADNARNQIRSMVSGLSQGVDLAAVDASVAQALTATKTAALLNVSFRRALQPAVKGMENFREVFSVVSSWSQLEEELIPGQDS